MGVGANSLVSPRQLAGSVLRGSMQRGSVSIPQNPLCYVNNHKSWNAESAALFHHTISLVCRQCIEGQHAKREFHTTHTHTVAQSHDTMNVPPCHVDTHTYQAASRRKPLPLPLPGSRGSLCTNVWPTQLNTMMWR